jgi:flagellar hook protein FlgE
MMRSLFSGVSGLKNHQTRMDVIGNNISNVNTHGFKSSRVTFQDMISQTIAGASKPQDTRGGVNPKQVGLGMTVASIDKIFTQGSLQVTGNQTDLAISGDGFFVVADGDKNLFTRAGTFALDKEGTLVNPGNGLKVQGWMARTNPQGDKVVDSSGTPEDLIVPIYGKVPARETTDVRYKCNLDTRVPIVPQNANEQMIASAAITTNIDIYDEQGGAHRLTMKLWHTGVNEWTASAAISDTVGPITLDVEGGANQPNQPNPTSRMKLRFSPNGRLVSAEDGATPDAINQGTLNVKLNYLFTSDGSTPTGTGSTVRKTINLNLGESGLINGITQFESKTTTKGVEQNGYTMGYMQGFNVDSSGVITGVYSNGTKQVVGQVAMAVFTNPQGLTAAGDNTFEVSNNSGLANYGPALEGGRGKMVAGTLEMSNVDLSDQFTDMIVTQRGFQANSRTITTSDQMLQELINLKR